MLFRSVSTTLFQMIRSKIFISDCVVFFDTIATFTQTIAGWVVLAGKNVAQISDGISNPVVAGIINWLIRILICGGCLVGVGILLAFIEIKIAGLYKKYCWDMITIMVILVSMAIAIYFGDWIKEVLPINLLFLLLFVQLVYVVKYKKGFGKWMFNRLAATPPVFISTVNPPPPATLSASKASVIATLDFPIIHTSRFKAELIAQDVL